MQANEKMLRPIFTTQYISPAIVHQIILYRLRELVIILYHTVNKL